MKKTFKLTDAWARAAQEFGARDVFHDSELKGFRVRFGVHRITFFFFQEHCIHGVRSTTCKRLGHWPATTTDDARRAALVIAGGNASGRIEPGRRTAVKVNDALDEYLAHLRAQSARKGKLAKWAYAVESICRVHIRPRWGAWTLAEISDSPAAIRDWHMQVSRDRGPVIANKSAKVMRAAYKFAAKLNRGLPPALPTSAIVLNQEHARQVSIVNWPAWRAAWEAIGSPVRRAFHLTQLLTGGRGSELSALRWRDIHPRQRSMTFVNSKSGSDVTIPLSIEIVKTLRMARDASEARLNGVVQDWIFPGSGKSGHIAKGSDGLSVSGHALRHQYRTICAELEISDLVSSLLLGHSLQGVSRKYVHVLAMQSGAAMRKAQARISRRLYELLVVEI
jgi:integrase